jgi:hypothetical protein
MEAEESGRRSLCKNGLPMMTTSNRAKVKVIGMRPTAAVLLGLAISVCGAAAQEFQVTKVTSITAVPINQLKPKTILFNDHRDDEIADRGNGFIRFEDWARVMPVQKQFLSLYPSYAETMVTRTVEGLTKTYKDKLHVYVTEARFPLSKPVASISLNRYATLAFMESIDPAIKHQVIKPSDISILQDDRNANNKNPDREWCEGKSVTVCIRSRYQLEGKIPMGIALANKLRDNDKRLSNFVEFESEVRLPTPAEMDEAGLKKLTGIDTPVAGVLEQSIFSVNQIMRFGKFLAIMQPHPTNANNTIATVMIVLAVSSTTLEMKKNYEDVPVLRNLVPGQVLMGNSSFNTGNSISSGLPNYARNRIKAIAEILDRD